MHRATPPTPQLDGLAHGGPPRLAATVVVAAGDAATRRALVAVLDEAGHEVLAEAADGRGTVDLVRQHRPDVLVLDLVLPVLDGMGVLRAIGDREGPTRVLLLTTAGDDALALLAMRLGADGYLAKELELATLPELVARVVAGDTTVSRQLTGKLVRRLRAVRGDGGGLRPVRSVLTDREWETLDLLCVGRSTTEIASELFLSVETVRTHVKGILRKLDLRSRAEAVEWATRLREDLMGVEPEA